MPTLVKDMFALNEKAAKKRGSFGSDRIARGTRP
jgi:hypothetical protein